MEKGGGKNRWLAIVLVVLGVVIVGLVIGIVIVRLQGNGDVSQGGEDDCNSITDEYKKRTCLAKLYESGGNDEAEDAYVDAIKESIGNEDYDLFDNLIVDRVFDLALNNECEKAFDFLDNNEWFQQLPIEEQVHYYSVAVDVSVECGDEEKQSFYEEKYRAILNSEEVQNSDLLYVEQEEIESDEE